MKKRFLLTGAAAVLVLATVVGGSLAAGQVSGSQAVTAPLAAQTLKIQLNSEAGGSGVSQPQALSLQTSQGKNYMPGDAIPLTTDGQEGAFSVTNTGSVDAYVRVTVTKYWQNDYEKLPASQLEAQLAGGDWIESTADDLFGATSALSGETQVFYYARPLAPGETTSMLLKSIRLKEDMGNEYVANSISLSAEADGVQFAGAAHNPVNEKGILSAWGVAASLDASGSITGITQ